MADPRNIAHDKTVALDKKHEGKPLVEDAAETVQPGQKPKLQHHAKDDKPQSDKTADQGDHSPKPVPDHDKD